MIVNTRRLFARLLTVLEINAVCDVRSMNGADALMCRDVLSRARIYAFEPNPENFCLMQDDRALRERAIELVPFAATNYDGEAEFFVVKADYWPNAWRGMSFALPALRWIGTDGRRSCKDSPAGHVSCRQQSA